MSQRDPLADLAAAAGDERPLHEHLRGHARRAPGKPAYLWYGAALSFGELDALSDGFAARLAALGVRRGEPVALFLNNCPQYVIAHYGIQKRGAIVCPCGPLNKAHELRHQLADTGARAVVAADGLLPIVEQVRGETAIEHVFATGYAEWLPEAPAIDPPAELAALRGQPRALPAGVEDFLSAARAGLGQAAPAVAIDPAEDVALMTYTSGTTGLPKGAMLTYRNALAKTRASVETMGISGEDVLLAVAPLYHIAGMLMGVNIPVLSGATAVLLHRFDPAATLQAIERHRVTWWYSVAPMNVAVMNAPGAREADLSSLRRNPVTSFGIAFTEALARQWEAFAPNCRSMEAAYGLSETHTMDTYMPADAIRWGTHGVPVPGNEIRILDPDTGQERPRGETGEIVLRNAGVFKGYWRQPEATARTLRDGWVHTGDIGRIDEAGYLTFIGRFKEMIKVSGYSVFPEEVESILVRHPAVAQAAVIGVPDPEKGEVVKAFVVKRPAAAGGAAPADGSGVHADDASLAAGIVAWARENMAPYKAPREIAFIDALPATGAGKVLRRLLKDPAR